MNQRFLLGGALTVAVAVTGILLEAWAVNAPLDMLFGLEDFSAGILGRSLVAAAAGSVLLVAGYLVGTRSGFVATT